MDIVLSNIDGGFEIEVMEAFDGRAVGNFV